MEPTKIVIDPTLVLPVGDTGNDGAIGFDCLDDIPVLSSIDILEREFHQLMTASPDQVNDEFSIPEAKDRAMKAGLLKEKVFKPQSFGKA